MLHQRIKNRMLFLILLVFTTSILIFLILNTLRNNILFFLTPSEIILEEEITKSDRIRVGGMVKKNSLKIYQKEIQFIITDTKNEILVNYSGAIPNLFVEGKGVIAEGKLKDKKFFLADRILAKHDENYLPPNMKNKIEKNVK
tara:strand:- start:81 stop:509 length:429 start_codon:yes stop_codon:yes gene_type:complete